MSWIWFWVLLLGRVEAVARVETKKLSYQCLFWNCCITQTTDRYLPQLEIPVWRRFSLMFTQFLKTCSHHDYKHVYTHLKTSLHLIRRHVDTMLEDMFALCFKTCLHHVWNVPKFFLKTYLHHVWRHAFTIFEDVFIPCLEKTCLLFTPCLFTSYLKVC